VDTLRNRESFEVTRSELQAVQAQLDDARTELRALRSEEQRATMLEDELRATKAELDSAVASHRADLVERETEFEGLVRAAREEFQGQIASLETRHEDDLATRDRRMATRLEAAEAAAAAKVERVRQELADRDARYGVAEQVVAEAKEEATRLGEELTRARLELDETVQRLLSETNSVRELSERAEFVQREAADASARAERLAEELDDATQSNADLNRRLQELESRRALEIANVEGRADLDQLLRVTQERLAGQTERLIAAEDNAHRLERELKGKLEQIDQIEGELRHVQMAEAMRQLRGEGHEAAEAPAQAEGAALPAPPAGLDADGLPFEDRRATSPFMKELSHDARKSLTQILGLTQILKHKKDAKEQAQLVRQLTTYARRLDHVVSDMADADKLVRGTVELTVRRTDLEALVHRVVEESGVGSDHELRIDAERVVVALDQLRTEQILAGLLRSAADRTPLKRPITVRLENHDGGALLSVEDPEPSSDASLSPVVQRFAEMQGGWAKVESGPDGGSAFRVFLPDGAKASEDAPIVVADQEVEVAEEQEAWSPDGAQLLVQELHRLSEISAED
jgi:signal transduction histidine kinase